MKMVNRVSLLMGLMFVTTFLVGTGWTAIPQPTATFTGIFNTSAAGGLTLYQVRVNTIAYLDGSTTNTDTAEETLVGADVLLSNVTYDHTDGAGNYFFADGGFSISDESGTFFAADLVRVVVTVRSGSQTGLVNIGLETNLQNVVLNTALGSRFINEFAGALEAAQTNVAALSLTLDLATGNFDGDSFGNARGLLDGAPILDPRTIGFWKQQIEPKNNGSTKYTAAEMNLIIQKALNLDASLSNVFNGDAVTFKADATSKGKRDMVVRARQQLSALLLNIVSFRLTETVPFSLPEFTTATNVGEALMEVEQIITSSGGDLETAKDIADYINNGIGI